MIHNIAEELAVNNSVVGTYQKLVKKCTNSTVWGIMNPWNKRQIKNLQNCVRAKKCISRDDIYNFYAMATEFYHFFWQIDCCNVPYVPGIGPWIACDKYDHWCLQSVKVF